jgi:hypothetical protein
MTLPRRAPQTFEIALSIHPADGADLEALLNNGWKIVDPRMAATDPTAFRKYVQGSGGEFSAAQGMYVESQCGWISDRTVQYLATGKPALVQDTGFSRNYPVGEGLVAFRTLDEAARAPRPSRAITHGMRAQPASWPRRTSIRIRCCLSCSKRWDCRYEAFWTMSRRTHPQTSRWHRSSSRPITMLAFWETPSTAP